MVSAELLKKLVFFCLFVFCFLFCFVFFFFTWSAYSGWHLLLMRWHCKKKKKKEKKCWFADLTVSCWLADLADTWYYADLADTWCCQSHFWHHVKFSLDSSGLRMEAEETRSLLLLNTGLCPGVFNRPHGVTGVRYVWWVRTGNPSVNNECCLIYYSQQAYICPGLPTCTLAVLYIVLFLVIHFYGRPPTIETVLLRAHNEVSQIIFKYRPIV